MILNTRVYYLHHQSDQKMLRVTVLNGNTISETCNWFVRKDILEIPISLNICSR